MYLEGEIHHKLLNYPHFYAMAGYFMLGFNQEFVVPCFIMFYFVSGLGHIPWRYSLYHCYIIFAGMHSILILVLLNHKLISINGLSLLETSE